MRDEEEEDDDIEMTDENREKIFVNDEMEECEDVKDWITTTPEGNDSWVNIIVDVKTGEGYRWTKQQKKFEDRVKNGRRQGPFWYARWGIYNIVAAKEGTESAVRMRETKASLGRDLKTVRSKKGFGRLIVYTVEEMEDVWIQ